MLISQTSRYLLSKHRKHTRFLDLSSTSPNRFSVLSILYTQHRRAMADSRADAEKHIKRNPHPDFKKVEASRPDYNDHDGLKFTKTKETNWKPGQGANDGGASLKKKHVEIDPYAEGRPAVYNYKLLISAITPRFIGFVSTRSKDGEQI